MFVAVLTQYRVNVSFQPMIELVAADHVVLDASLPHAGLCALAATVAHEQIASQASDAAQEGGDLGLLQKITTMCVQCLDGYLAQLSDFVGS